MTERITSAPTVDLVTLLAGLTEGEWRQHALCRGLSPDLFHPSRGENDVNREAKAVCAECPVSTPCLDHALNNNEIHGIWGGKSERQRRRIRQHRLRQARNAA